MDLRALTAAKRHFRRFGSVERAAFAEILRRDLVCDAARAESLIDDLRDGAYVFERVVAGVAVLTPGPNLDSGVLSLVGVRVPPY